MYSITFSRRYHMNLKRSTAAWYVKATALACIFLIGSTALNAQSITKTSAGTATTASLVGGSINWTSFNVSQIQNADGTNASVTVAGKKSSYHIRATNWGYAIGGSGGFPTGATLSGIKVEIKRNVSQGAAVDAPNLQLMISGAATGSSRSRNRTQWTSQSGYVTYGSTSDKWGSSLTINDIVNSTFGVQLAAKGALKGSNNSIANIDHIRITIYYNLGVYYSKSTGSLASLSTWGVNSDGTGTAPTNFTNDAQIFVVTNRSAVSLDAALTISGANSKLVVGDINNALAKTTLTISSTFAYNGVLDCSSKDGTTANSSDLVIANTSIPTFGNLEQGTTVTYNAAGNQAVSQANYDNLTISGIGTKTIQSTGNGIRSDGVLTISSGATLALNGQTLINSADPAGTANCIINNGTISGSGEVYLLGDGLSIISGTGSISTLENDNTNGLSIPTGANQTVTTSLILSSGSFANSGTFAMGTGSTIYRDQGVFSATSPGANAYDVSYTSSFLDDGVSTNAPGNELAGTNLRNVSVDLPVTETITLNTTRTVKGNFSINTGTFNAGSNTINLAGNFTNNSTFTASTSTVVLNGSSAATQTIGGTGTVTFSNLTVNTTGTGGVTLTKDITVSTALTLTAGKVTTGSNTLIYSLAAGTVTRTSGYVAGNLRKNISTGATARTFEVGTTNYTPIQVSFASVTTAGTLDATVTSGDNPNIGSSNIDASKSVNTYWEVTKPSGSTLVFTTYGITASYTSAENDATLNATLYKVGKYASSAWSYVVPVTTPTSTQLIIPTNSFASASGFGQFQVGVQGTQPIVSAQPSNQITCNSASTSFSATASSGIISSVVWQISTNNGGIYSNLTISSPYSVTNPSLPTILNAAATTTLNISNSSGLNGNLYRAVFTNVTGGANSNSGLLTANSNPGITTQPVVQVACVGSAATFSVVATGGSLTYQWRKGGSNISGATSSSYSISSVVTGDAGNYDVIVTNTCSSVTSSAVALTVNELPVITTQPTSQTVCSGNITTFTIAASGSGLSYQWQKDNIALVNGVNGVSGATSATLTISPTPVSAAGIYNVVVTGTCSPFATSNDVVLTVDEGAVITGHPSGQTVCAGTTNVQFTVAATGTGLTYQWKKDGNSLSNGVNISGATTTTLTLATAAAADAGSYNVVMGTTNCTSGITSNGAALTITTPVIPSVSIAVTSGSNPTCSGTSVMFTATPANGGTPSYQWQKDGVNVGTNSATYTDAGTTTGSITCIMTTSISCVTTTTATSNTIALNITAQVTPFVSIAITSGSNPTCSGSSVTFTATPTNGGTPSYQWQKDGVNVGTNSATYTDAGTTAGSITCIMTTSVSCVTTTTATSNAIALSINAKVTPSVSIAITSGSNPTCSGSSVSFTATPTNGGTPSYQWQKDGVNVGTNSATYTDAGTTAGSITCIMTTSISCVTTLTATSNGVVLVVIANTWLASTDGNWSNPANWCSGIVPSASTDVTIPTANTPYPVLSADVSVKALEIQNGATLTIGAHTLTVNDVVTGTGTITGSSASNLTINGPGSVTNSNLLFTTGAQVLKNLTVSNITATLNTPLSITAGAAAGTVTVTNGVLASGGNLTLSSDGLGTARVAPGSSAGGYITGDVSVERYIPQNPNRAWRLLSIPTVGQTIHESWQENQPADVDPLTRYGTILTSNSASWLANGYDEKTPGNSLLSYDQANDKWVGLPNTAASIATTSGYFVYIRGDRGVKQSSSISAINATNLRTKGTLYQGTQAAITIPAGKDALIGNVYPSAIDLRNIALGGGSANTSFSVWDPKLTGSYGLGAYQTFTQDNGSYIVTPGGGSYGVSGSVNNTVQSGQAFFVTAFATDGTVTLTEAAKTSGSTSTVFSPPSSPTNKRLITNLYAVTDTTTNLADGTMHLFDDSFDANVDGVDARKLYNFGENFYISKDSKDLVVEKRKLLTVSDTIRFAMETLKRKTYQLEFIARDLDDNNLSGWLEDSYTKGITPINLNGTTTVKFTLDANSGSSAINRFQIVFKQNAILAVIFEAIKAYPNNNDIIVEWKVNNQVNVQSYAIEKSTNGRDFTKVGTVVATGIIGATVSYDWLDAKAVEGDNFYRVISTDKNGSRHYSQVVKVHMAKGKNSIQVYPNPVTNNLINLRFSRMTDGTYTARLLSSNGALVMTKKILLTGSNTMQPMTIPGELSNGNYLLEVIHPDKSKTIQSLIIAR
jgi:hypothetical protein